MAYARGKCQKWHKKFLVVILDIIDRTQSFISAAYGGSVAKLAEGLGTSRTSIYKYLRREASPGRRWVDRLYDVGCNPGWLMTGQGEMYADNAAGRALRERVEGASVDVVAEEVAAYRLHRKRQMMQLFITPVRAGIAPPIGHDEEGFEWVNIADEMQIPRDGAWMLEVTGESMVGDRISPGDRLIVSKAEPADGDVVVAAHNGSVTVKRYSVRRGTVWLYPSDLEQQRDPIKVLPDDVLVVWGVVHAIIHPVRRKPVGR